MFNSLFALLRTFISIFKIAATCFSKSLLCVSN